MKFRSVTLSAMRRLLQLLTWYLSRLWLVLYLWFWIKSQDLTRYYSLLNFLFIALYDLKICHFKHKQNQTFDISFSLIAQSYHIGMIFLALIFRMQPMPLASLTNALTDYELALYFSLPYISMTTTATITTVAQQIEQKEANTSDRVNKFSQIARENLWKIQQINNPAEIQNKN